MWIVKLALNRPYTFIVLALMIFVLSPIVSDGFALQTNVVRQDGRRGVLMSILKAGNASTLSVVRGVKSLLPYIAKVGTSVRDSA